MKILILDDDPSRVKKLRRELVGNVIVHAQTSGEGIAALRTTSWALVLLDHDLNQFGHPDPGTGKEVVAWIVRHRDLFHNTVFCVHSLNPVHGPGNYRMLKNAGLEVYRCPSIWDNPGQLAQLLQAAA